MVLEAPTEGFSMWYMFSVGKFMSLMLWWFHGEKRINKVYLYKVIINIALIKNVHLEKLTILV
jgi:hypothetical protein